MKNTRRLYSINHTYENPNLNSITLEEGLDAAYPILKERKAMLILDLCREIVEKAKADADFSYAEFLDVAEEDSRFQVVAGQIVGISREYQELRISKMDDETINTLLRLYFDEESYISLKGVAINKAIIFSEELQRSGYAKRTSKWGLSLT
ncbi:MAG: hypothetical protein A7315_10005 [Candidatus Altiarchaeales archaeon WOR_SM1_79]|nr:MAG: hypothetical protein A7315_10005 [Candidatus Altiarchaeales archaeon WOR_SM1_79]